MFLWNRIKDIARPLWGFIASILAVVAMVAIWWFDAQKLNELFDLNLNFIKLASAFVDDMNKKYQLLPTLGRGKVEAALRFISGEKLLLSFELALIIRYIAVLVRWFIWLPLWVIGLGVKAAWNYKRPVAAPKAITPRPAPAQAPAPASGPNVVALKKA